MTQSLTPAGPNDPLLWTSLSGLSIPNHAVVIADASLPPFLLKAFPDALLVDAGEGLKTLGTIENLAQRVLDRRATRPLTLVAVGGGSVGDAVGFLASVLWRGVELWHVPTTLLAMIDSAHGGKTAINLGQAKNQIGTFYPASRVILVPDILESLPREQRRSGLSELLKALWLGDSDGLSIWEDAHPSRLSAYTYSRIQMPLQTLISRAIKVKRQIVERDPYETHEIRTLLNLGHTIGHALELTCGLSHGAAVAWGLLSAGVASRAHGFSAADLERLFRSVYPLLVPLAPDLKADQLIDAMDRDKKKRAGELRSVLLSGAGQAYVTTYSAQDWTAALFAAINMWETRPVTLQHEHDDTALIAIEASKSELNRGLVIQYLAPSVEIEGPSSKALDVQHLRDSLTTLRQGAATPLNAGSGGTTLRFLLAIAAAHNKPVTIHADRALLARDHGPIIEALSQAGATIQTLDAEYRVTPWSKFPQRLKVSVARSSQHASALALLAASGHTFDLELTDQDRFASQGYFGMTLAMLRDAGVQFTTTERGVSFSGLAAPSNLAVSPDASSSAVWAVMNRLGSHIQYQKGSPLQPDTVVDQVLDRVETGTITALHTPDLVPVASAYAVSRGAAVIVTEAANLAGKESNRIEDLASLLRAAGAWVVTSESGFTVECVDADSAMYQFECFDDHRLAFAAAILSKNHPAIIRAPWVVRKSYPGFWHDLRAVGWLVEPVGT